MWLFVFRCHAVRPLCTEHCAAPYIYLSPHCAVAQARRARSSLERRGSYASAVASRRVVEVVRWPVRGDRGIRQSTCSLRYIKRNGFHAGKEKGGKGVTTWPARNTDRHGKTSCEYRCGFFGGTLRSRVRAAVQRADAQQHWCGLQPCRRTDLTLFVTIRQIYVTYACR